MKKKSKNSNSSNLSYHRVRWATISYRKPQYHTQFNKPLSYGGSTHTLKKTHIYIYFCNKHKKFITHFYIVKDLYLNCASGCAARDVWNLLHFLFKKIFQKKYLNFFSIYGKGERKARKIGFKKKLEKIVNPTSLDSGQHCWVKSSPNCLSIQTRVKNKHFQFVCEKFARFVLS